MRVLYTILPALGALLALGDAACLRATRFTCDRNDACGSTGSCEATGFCSFPDPACNGNRYDASAGVLAGQCVGSAAVACPADFVALASVTTNHVYKVLATPARESTQEATCTTLSAHAYLAVPDDATELAALTAAQAPALWLGLTRSMGSKFHAASGGNATFLPWQGGNPDNGAGRDCVTAVSTTEIQTEVCSAELPAVCECAPP